MSTLDKSPLGIVPQEVKVNFTAAGQPVEVNLHDVNRLFADMGKYNEQFSMGSMMSRLLLSHLEEERSENQTQSMPGVADEENNQQINAFFLLSAHQDLLNKIGLSLEPVSGKATIFSSESTANNSEIRVNVSNQENFTSFLGVLTPEQINKSGIKDGLEKVSDILSRQVLDKYNLQMPEEEAMQLFMGMDKIVSEYKRLGMGEAVSKLELYLEHGKIGDLREYVAIERKGLLSEPGKFFGPADWEIDSTPDMLEERWNEAIAVLEKVKTNEKAENLYEQLRSHLDRCVDIALERLTTVKHLTPEEREKMQTVLEVAKQKLGMLSPRQS